METMPIALLLIVAVSVLALIGITKKRKALEKEGVTVKAVTIDTGSTTAIPANTQTPSEPPPPAAPDQHTLYKFSTKSKSRLCPYCDGENGTGGKVCIICGHDI